MSRNHPLNYPAPAAQNRHFYPLKNIATIQRRNFLFDVIFRHRIMREHFKRISGHGTLPIIIGAAVTATGHSQMFVRSLAVLVCAIWLSLDIGVWISGALWRRQFKAMAFCAASSLLCCLSMGIMYWFLLSTLEDQRIDVFQKLTFSHFLELGAQDDPQFTHFTVTNGSSFTISRFHELTCLTVLAVGNAGSSPVSNIMTAQLDEKTLTLGHPIGFVLTPSKDVLHPGGDAETGQCLRSYGFLDEGTDCVDVILIFVYQLETQPGVNQEKKVRFVAMKGTNGRFEWYQQPIEHEGNYCQRFLKPRPVP